MTEGSQGPAASNTAANKGVKQGLPAFGLPSAEDAAAKLWGVARLGTVPPEAFARQFGEKAKATGSTWDTRMALLRGLKLIRREDKNIGLSPLGQQLVNRSDPEAQRTARRSAVLNLKAYRELVDSFDGEALPDSDALATKLQFEYGKTEDFAKRAAKAFVESLTHAEMLGPGNTVLRDGQSTAPPVPAASEVDSDMALESEDEVADAEIDAAFNNEDDDPEMDVIVRESSSRRGAATVSLNMSLDLSRFRADEVIEIITALGLARRA